jgi:hypothetical protein
MMEEKERKKFIVLTNNKSERIVWEISICDNRKWYKLIMKSKRTRK